MLYLLKEDYSQTARQKVMDIEATSSAFAALRLDGSVVTWGMEGQGPNLKALGLGFRVVGL